MHHPLVTSNHQEFSVDQEFDQSVCWSLPLLFTAMVNASSVSPMEHHFDLTLRGSTHSQCPLSAPLSASS